MKDRPPVLPGMFGSEPEPFTAPRFDGADYVPARDHARLSGQILRIWTLMRDGRWRTMGEIEHATGDPQPSISAQLRHLRKDRFGAHTVEKRHRGDASAGLYQYRLIPNPLTGELDA